MSREIDKQKIIHFASKGVEKFIRENPTLRFYSFAFDCNAEYAEINLCFNTEEAFAETLSYYQRSEFSDSYQTQASIASLKYNPGDWKYQSFDTLYVFSEEELEAIFTEIYPDEVNDNYLAWHNFISELLTAFTESLIEFSKTSLFNQINKTADFNYFCLDHDEEIEQAMRRMKAIQER